MSELVKLSQWLEQKYNKIIHIRGQWDNAIPYVEKALLQLIADLFGKFGCEWTTQPVHTPLSYAMDATLSPALTKGMPKIQGLFNKGRYLQCEKIWEVFKQMCAKYPDDKILATYEYDVGNGFVCQHKGLSFGV